MESHRYERASRAELSPQVTRIDISGRTLAKVVVAALLTVWALRLFSSIVEVIVMVVLATLLATVLSALVDWLQSKGVGRTPAAVVSLLSVLLVVTVVLTLALPVLIKEFALLLKNVPSIVEGLRVRLAGRPEIYEGIVRELDALRQDPTPILHGALSFGLGATSSVLLVALMLPLTFYLLLDGGQVLATLLRLTPHAYRARVEETLAGGAGVVRGYFIGQSIVSTIFAAATFLLFTVLDVPYAVVFAALAFFLDAVPNVGAFLAAMLPALIALASRGVTTALIVVAVMLVYQQIEDALIKPRVLGKRLEMPAVLTLVAVLVGGKLFGVVGVILAIPLAGMLPVIDRVWIRRAPAVSTGPSLPTP
jgi:predicted PurR-regulated permease PerM